ncbi:MAG TPA: serine/threonine protein kinase [Streptosporangiaceae bacterium]
MPSSTLLAHRYRLDHQIAAGGAGQVWQAEDIVLARPVAVKLLRAEFAGHADTLDRFRAEARHAGRLSHPAIARVFDYGEGEPPDPPFLVMELVNGPSLAAVLARGPLAPDRAMDVIAQVAAGLTAAHAAGLVHRDIKPANLLLGPDGQVKITDFGIAHAAGSAPVTWTGTVVGTPAYLAPERVAGAPATPAADLYSLGMVGYECLAGVAPFTGPPVEVALAHREQPLPPFPPTVPVGAAQLITELTAKDPAARPVSAAEVAARASHLRDLLAGRAGSNAGPLAVGPVAQTASLPAVLAPTLHGPVLPGPGWHGPTRRGLARRGGWPRSRIAAAVAVPVVLALLGLALVLRSAGGPPAGASAGGSHPPSASARAPATVELATGPLIGQPLGVARERLQQLGLVMRVQWQPSGADPGTVLAVEPNGPVRAGSTIVVTAATDGHGHDHGNGGFGGDQGGNGNGNGD